MSRFELMDIRTAYERAIRGRTCNECDHCEVNPFSCWGICLELSELGKDCIVFVHRYDDTPAIMDCRRFESKEEKEGHKFKQAS